MTRSETLTAIIEAEARGDFEAAREAREALKWLDAVAAATAKAEERAQQLGVFVLDENHLHVHVFDPAVCCLRIGMASIEHENVCRPPHKKPGPNGIREIQCILDSYPPKCGYCRKKLYVARAR